MNILILGGNGFLGWPTSIYLSNRGHNITIVDNFYKDKICKKININTLYEVPELNERIKIWKNLSGNQINFYNFDLQDPKKFKDLFENKLINESDSKHNFELPDVVIHFAEQPSAPYSMMDIYSSKETLINNVAITNNLVFCVKEYCINAHIIHLATMGEYGTPNIDIEEGWLKINHKNRSDDFLFPRQGNSIYHTSKIMDTDLLWFACRNWGIKVTDLMQGPVYGTDTDETLMDTRLSTKYYYDEIFGTVLNRFIVQATCNHPLTVYGKGNQKRGFINIRDVMKCIEHAISEKLNQGQLKIYNQITEVFSVNQLANKVKNALLKNNLKKKIDILKIENPRKEKEDHYYNPTYTGLEELGLKSTKLKDSDIQSMYDKVKIYESNIDKKFIIRNLKWF